MQDESEYPLPPVVDSAGYYPIDHERSELAGKQGTFSQTPPPKAVRTPGHQFQQVALRLKVSLLLAQLDVPIFKILVRSGWRLSLPWATSSTQVFDGKALREFIAENDTGVARCIAQESLYSQSLGVEIAQATYTSVSSAEIPALWELQEAVELEGVLNQAVAVHAKHPYACTWHSAAGRS